MGKDTQLISDLQSLGYSHVKRLESGEMAGIAKMAYTTGLFLGLDDSGYRTRYCYHGWEEAAQAIEDWNGNGDPPGMWIKQKGEVERSGPGSK